MGFGALLLEGPLALLPGVFPLVAGECVSSTSLFQHQPGWLLLTPGLAVQLLVLLYNQGSLAQAPAVRDTTAAPVSWVFTSRAGTGSTSAGPGFALTWQTILPSREGLDQPGLAWNQVVRIPLWEEGLA